MKLLIINGPNLNMLGRREPEIYGGETLKDIEKSINDKCGSEGVEAVFAQRSGEGEIIDLILGTVDDGTNAVILNAGAYTHYSYAIRDAIAAVKALGVPVIEVHISNVNAREDFRKISVIAPVCAGTIAGFGSFGYLLAVDAAINLIRKEGK